jgi:hypothetical protein
MIGGDSARAALIGQVAAAALAPGLAAAAAPPAPVPAPAPPAQLPAQAATGGSDSPADIERQIDALTERLSEGKISEETFNKLVARLEAKLAKLQGV